MVQEYVSPVRVHKYPFEMVMAAYERRFPNCPQIPVVMECVITDDSWTGDDSQRHTTRRCQLNVEAPYLLKKMIGVDYIYFIQKNHLDLKGRVLEIEATNETFASRVGVVEKCRYYVHPENSDWTCFEQSALLDVKNFFGLENTVEKIAMKQYAANIAKGKELIESFMMEVHADGVKELRPWAQNDPEYNRELRRIVSRGTEPLSPRTNPEPKRHSQPGISGTSIIPLLSKSSQKLPNTFKRCSPSSSNVHTSRTKLTLSSGDLPSKKTSQARVRHKSEERIDHSPKSSTKLNVAKLFRRSKTEIKNKENKEEFRDDRKKVTLSQPNLNLESEDSLGSLNINLKQGLMANFKTCDCPPPSTQGTMNELLGRWDSLLVVLVCVMVIMLTMTAPLSWLMRRRSR